MVHCVCPAQVGVHFSWLLATHDHQFGMDVSAVLARLRTPGPVFETLETLLRETTRPLRDGAHNQSQRARDLLVIPSSSPKNNLGAVGCPLRTRAGNDASFKLPTFLRLEHDGTPPRLRYAIYSTEGTLP
jgi:hypothetical protein